MCKISLILCAILIGALVVCAGGQCEPAEPLPASESWLSIESNYFTVYYPPGADLIKIKMALEKRALYFDQPARYGLVTAQEEISYRLDKLFNRVEEVLDMYPRIPKVKIKIFKERAELNEEYLKIFGRRDDFKAFYINRYNTIYTSESDISDSIMVHEMAHVIIDHYFSVIPPEKVREILSSYVDAHLEK